MSVGGEHVLKSRSICDRYKVHISRSVTVIKCISVIIMVKYTTEQRVFIVETYLLKKKSYDKCVRKFRLRFPDSTRPSKPYVHNLFKKWRETGSVLNKKKNRVKTVLTEDTLEDMQARLQVSPRKSSRRLAQECGISKTSVLRGLKSLKFYPYKVSVVHRLKDTDWPARVNFCREMLRSVHDGNVDPSLLFMSDEAWFHLSGYVNSQNTRYWDTENPNLVHEVPLHDAKVGVWCAVSGRRIIGPIFFYDTVNSERYVNNILQPFFDMLTEEEREYGYFQQDGATAHTSHLSMETIENVFSDRVISTGLWPARSPDLSACDFYLWGNLKQKVYKNNPRTVEALENEIRRAIAEITEAELRRVSLNFLRRCQVCLDLNGHHFQHLL